MLQRAQKVTSSETAARENDLEVYRQLVASVLPKESTLYNSDLSDTSSGQGHPAGPNSSDAGACEHCIPQVLWGGGGGRECAGWRGQRCSPPPRCSRMACWCVTAENATKEWDRLASHTGHGLTTEFARCTNWCDVYPVSYFHR